MKIDAECPKCGAIVRKNPATGYIAYHGPSCRWSGRAPATSVPEVVAEVLAVKPPHNPNLDRLRAGEEEERRRRDEQRERRRKQNERRRTAARLRRMGLR